MAEYFEGHKVGAWIRLHRESLGVRLSDLIHQAGAGSERILRHTERAQRPDIDLIEIHHTALMAAYVTSGHTPAVPLARREQWYANEYDATLWQDASHVNPRVSWWWGVRSNTAPRGAWCHLCNRMIHGYDAGRGMTPPARRAVMAHRLEHISKLTETSTTTTEASST